MDEKYYITNAAVVSRLSSAYECRKNSIVAGGGICRTLTARDYKEPTCVALFESEGEEATTDTAGTSSGRIQTMKKTDCRQVGILSGEKWDKMHDISRRIYDPSGVAPTVHTCGGGNLEPKIAEPIIGAIRGRNPENPSDRRAGIHTEQRLEINPSGMSNTLTTVQKDNVVVIPDTKAPTIIDDTYGYDSDARVYSGTCPTLRAGRQGLKVFEEDSTPDPVVYDDYNSRVRADQSTIGTPTTNYGVKLIETGQGFRVRKLTPRECWRLMGQTDKAYDAAKQATHFNKNLTNLTKKSIDLRQIGKTGKKPPTNTHVKA